MQLINRNVVVIKPKQPFLDWVNHHPGLPGLTPPISWEEAQQDCTVLLVPELDGPDESQDYLATLKLQLLEMELESWHRDPTAWPSNRTPAMFDEWFGLEIHSMVWDLLDEAIAKEE